jgi:two-component system, cell cycle sensor histidine kinase and response regulator CckA
MPGARRGTMVFPQRVTMNTATTNVDTRIDKEQALEQAAQKWRTTFDSIGDMIFLLDKEGTVLQANKPVSQHLNLPFEKIVGVSCRGLFHGATGSVESCPFERVKKSLKRESQELRMADRWFIANIDPIFDDAGNLSGAVLVMRDITERREIEDAVRASEERFRRAIEHAPFPVMIHAEDGAILALSGGWTEQSGYSPSDIPTITDWTEKAYGVHKDSLRARIKAIYKAPLGKDEGEFSITRKDGTRRTWDFKSSSLGKLPDGRRAVITMAKDVTERMAAEQALKESEEKYRSLVERANDGIIIAQDGIIKFANARMADIDGGSVEKLLGSPLAAHINGPDIGRVMDYYVRRMKGETPPSIYEAVLKRSDGSAIPCELNAGLTNFQGKPADLIVVRDVSERKQSEATLQQLVRDLLFISHSAMELVELPPEKDIYRLICEQIEQAAPFNAILAVSEFDQTAGVFRPKCITGIEKTAVAIKKILGVDPMKLSGDFGPEARKAIMNGKLRRVETGLRDFFGVIPESAGNAVQKLLGITGIYVVGFVKEGKILGGLAILLRGESAIPNLSSIETLAAQAAMAIAKRRAETALSENEMRYRMVFDHAKDGIALADAETGRIVDCNQAMCNLVRRDKSDIVGKLQSDLHPPRPLAGGMTAGFQQSRNISGERIHEDVLLSKSGEEIPVETRVGYVEMNGRKYLLGIFRDITERKRAQESLLESERKYRMVVENANEAIIIAQEGKLAYANPQALQILKARPENVIGRPFTDFIHPDDRAMVVERYRQRLRGEKTPDGYEFRVVGIDNAETWVYLSSVAVDWESRPATLNFLVDLTKSKLAEKEKEKIQAQFLQAQKMEAVGQLAGGVAHDFNNLLSAISGYTSLAMMKVDESDPLHRDLKQVSNAASKAANLVRQLLLFSRKQPMEPAPLKLNATVTSLVKMLSRLIGENVCIEINAASDLWTIAGDEGNIEQVIMNLAVNARDAMPGGGRLVIKTENVVVDETHCNAVPQARPGHFVRMSMADTGTGMDKKTVSRIFEPFFTTKGPGKGTGLGLSVVLGIVQEHKGWIEVQSEPGKGTTFTVYFPSMFFKTETRETPAAPRRAVSGHGERILVVEDHEEVRLLAVEILSTNGYAVFPASSAKEARALFERENGKFDLVFSDVGLPDASGVRLVDELLGRGPLRVIFSSGYTDEKANWDYIKNKNFRFLRKPYSIPDLLAAARDELAGRKTETADT